MRVKTTNVAAVDNLRLHVLEAEMCECPKCGKLHAVRK